MKKLNQISGIYEYLMISLKKGFVVQLAAILAIFSFDVPQDSFAQALPAYTPPAGSPLARKVHPRLFFTAETLPAMRQRLSTVYASEFQGFITAMDGFYSESIDNIQQNYKFHDARNFAFLYLIDPSQMPSFRFGHTREEYGRRAIDLAMRITLIRGYVDGHDSPNLRSFAGGYINLALGCVYDWCFPLLKLAEKQKIAQGLIDLYTNREKDANPDMHVQLSNQLLGHAQHGSVGAITFWGDGLGEPYDSKAQEMLNFMKAMYIDRIFDTATHVMENSSGWSEGWNYQFLSFNNAKMFAGAASTALGTNFFKTCSWFRQYPLQFLCNVLPYQIDGKYFFSRNDAGQLEAVRGERYTRTLITICAALAKDDPNMASLAKWLLQVHGDDSKLKETPRAYALLYDFIWGCKDVPAKSPQQLNLPLTQKLGLGQIVMRSSWDDAATRLTFWAQKWWLAPHSHLDQASFTIEKFGPLALDGGVDKGGGFDMGKSKYSRATINHNVIGVRNPIEKGNNLLDYQMEVNDEADVYTDPSYQPGGANQVGEVEAFESVPGQYDYINYNYSRSYRGGQSVNLARREFVYLRAANPNAPNDQEYVVITDKINTLKAEYEKRFMLHTPFQPDLVDDTWTTIDEGVSESTNGRTVRVTNTYSNCHGRLFMKSIFPGAAKLVRIGGPVPYWFTDADYNDISLRPPFNELTALWGGSARIEIKPATSRTYDVFLTVLQIGDANTLQQMADATDLSGAQFCGTYIKNAYVVLFSKNENLLDEAEWTIEGNGEIEHLLVDMQPGASYRIFRNEVLLVDGEVNANGTIWFRDNPKGTATYRLQTYDRAVAKREQMPLLSIRDANAVRTTPVSPLIEREVVNQISKYDRVIDQIAAEEQVPSSLIRGIIAAESGGDPLSGKGSNSHKGLMQADTGDDQLIPAISIRTGVQKLKEYRNLVRDFLQSFGIQANTWYLTLIAYNAGPSTLKKAMQYAAEAGNATSFKQPMYFQRSLIYWGAYSARSECLNGRSTGNLVAEKNRWTKQETLTLDRAQLQAPEWLLCSVQFKHSNLFRTYIPRIMAYFNYYNNSRNQM